MSLSFATGSLLNSLCCCRESAGGSTKAVTLLKLAFVLMSLVMVTGAAAGVGKSKENLNRTREMYFLFRNCCERTCAQ